MHVWTRLKPEAVGRTGIGLYPDGMVEHDDHVGMLLDQLEKLGIADNTIVIYSTDNGAEKGSWPDGGVTPFHGEKGTTWEGGFRVPMLVRWPGTVKPGSKSDALISQEDWLPTLLAAAGEDDIVDKLKKGHRANGKRWKVHLDGYNFKPYFSGEVSESPREEIIYFDAEGNLNAVRWNDWKVSFATQQGNITDAVRFAPQWPLLTNLKADPYEEMHHESGMYLRWYADNMWLFVPIQQMVANFFGSLADYPMQEGMALNPAGINYQTLKARKVLEELSTKGLLDRTLGN
jgi:arylsulfatase